MLWDNDATIVQRLGEATSCVSCNHLPNLPQTLQTPQT